MQNSDNQMHSGTVKWFDAKKGYGFIVPDNGGPDMFVHAKELEKSRVKALNEKDRVTYFIGKSKGKTHAVDIEIVR